LCEQDFAVQTPTGDLPARLQLQTFYDPARTRILDAEA
jgi:hypothetical protein